MSFRSVNIINKDIIFVLFIRKPPNSLKMFLNQARRFGGEGRCEPPNGSRAEPLWGPGGPDSRVLRVLG